MSNVIVGLQWGDEGKGKITDVLAAKSDYVVRYQGGNNAGHSVYIGENSFVLHLIPSGVAHPNKKCIIGDGVVVDPKALLKEFSGLEEKGIDTTQVFLSSRAHLIMPYHILIDTYREEARGDDKIGTTKRGIGPCYEDRVARTGIQAVDLLFPEIFRNKLRKNIEAKNEILTKLYGKEPMNLEAVLEEYMAYGEQLRHRIIDGVFDINNAIKEGKKILFEGAQALLLDVTYGTYPFVTSSNPSTGGVSVGTGVPPTALNHLIGIAKAYCTRVGEGPFPTELFDENGAHMAKVGHEFGATTGRPRRCGWLDLPALKYACMINGINNLVITKLDVLSGLDEVKVCTAYKNKEGKIIDFFPACAESFKDLEPVYETLPGWKEDIMNITSYYELPETAKDYVRFIEKQIDLEVSIISVGPDRTQNIIRKELI
ncbi:adenylosuccinate synthase [Flavobacteriaceae bacterium UJ101]|nr:adenylosuccinate synthase [Flavobacteriaceae bacterium UJ101]